MQDIALKSNQKKWKDIHKKWPRNKDKPEKKQQKNFS